MDAYYNVLLKLVALLEDGHTTILPPWGYFKPGYDLAPIEVRILDERFYVGVGVVPDVEIWPTRDDLATGRDAVLERAVELLLD